MAAGLDDHYARLAGRYDENWSHSGPFLAWMSGAIADRLEPALVGRRDPVMVDIGAGTGLFTTRLAERFGDSTTVVAVEPSMPMLDELPVDSPVRRVHAPAEQAVTSLRSVGIEHVDAMVMKEVVHHFADLAATLGDLVTMLSPAGRVLVVMLPPTIEYPLFDEALRRYEAAQPHYDDVGAVFEAAGLSVSVEIEGFPLSFELDRYLAMVRNRYMSVLSTFDDDELDAGTAQIVERVGGSPTVEFEDRFAFVLGTAPDRPTL